MLAGRLVEVTELVPYMAEIMGGQTVKTAWTIQCILDAALLDLIEYISDQ